MKSPVYEIFVNLSSPPYVILTLYVPLGKLGITKEPEPLTITTV